jgi:hypothetical protein
LRRLTSNSSEGCAWSLSALEATCSMA